MYNEFENKLSRFGITRIGNAYYNCKGEKIFNISAYLKGCEQRIHKYENDVIEENEEEYEPSLEELMQEEDYDFDYDDEFDYNDRDYDNRSYLDERVIFNEDGDILYSTSMGYDDEFLDMVEEGYFDEDDLRD